jgi:hypothetical protein
MVPNMCWELANGTPTLTYVSNIVLHNPQPVGPIENIFYQLANFSPISMIVCVFGFYYLFIYGNDHKLQFIATAFFILLAISMFSYTQRPSRIAPIYPPIFAAGAVFLEQWIEKYKSLSLKIIAVIFIVLMGSFSALSVLPMLQPRDLSNYNQMLGLSHGHQNGNLAVTHSFIAERLGWQDLAEKAIEVCQSLPSNDRKNLAVLARNKSEAAAIEYYDKSKVTNKVLCGHNNYYYWFPDDSVIETIVAVGFSRPRLEEFFEQVEDTGLLHTCAYGLDEENNLRYYICRTPKYSARRIKDILKCLY